MILGLWQKYSDWTGFPEKWNEMKWKWVTQWGWDVSGYPAWSEWQHESNHGACRNVGLHHLISPAVFNVLLLCPKIHQHIKMKTQPQPRYSKTVHHIWIRIGTELPRSDVEQNEIYHTRPHVIFLPSWATRWSGTGEYSVDRHPLQ